MFDPADLTVGGGLEVPDAVEDWAGETDVEGVIPGPEALVHDADARLERAPGVGEAAREREVHGQPGDGGEGQGQGRAEGKLLVLELFARFIHVVPAVLHVAEGGAEGEVERLEDFHLEAAQVDLGQVSGDDRSVLEREAGFKAARPGAEGERLPGVGYVGLGGAVEDERAAEVVVELLEELERVLGVDGGDELESQGERLGMVPADDVSVLGLFADRRRFEHEIVEVGLAVRPVAEDVAVLEPAAHAFGGVVIEAEAGVHVAGDGPVETLRDRKPLDLVVPDRRNEEAGRPAPAERIAHIGHVEDGDVLDAEDGPPHLHVVVLLEIGPGGGELPAGRRLDAGGEAHLAEGVEVVGFALDGRGFVEDVGLDTANGLVELPLLGIEVEGHFVGGDRLGGELDRNMTDGQNVLGVGVEVDLVGKELDVLVTELDRARSKDARLDLFLGVGHDGDVLVDRDGLLGGEERSNGCERDQQANQAILHRPNGSIIRGTVYITPEFSSPILNLLAEFHIVGTAGCRAGRGAAKNGP